MAPARHDPPARPASHSLLVRLTRTSPTHHRMDLVRADGTREQCELETRSCLLHDLVHFAVETEAALGNSFYGRLARGVAYEALAHEHVMAGPADELEATERVVGPLQGAWRSGLDPGAFVATLRAYQTSVGELCPAWLDEDLVARVGQRLRQLEGQWRATRFGAAMELHFP